jgi:hypothetical protein
MIAEKDCRTPSPLIMFACTVVCDALMKWQKNNGVPPKASKSKLKADGHDCSN